MLRGASTVEWGTSTVSRGASDSGWVSGWVQKPTLYKLYANSLMRFVIGSCCSSGSSHDSRVQDILVGSFGSGRSYLLLVEDKKRKSKQALVSG